MKTERVLDVTTLDLVHEGCFMITGISKKTPAIPAYACFGEKYITLIIGELSKTASELLSVLVQTRELNTNEARYTVTGVNNKCKLTKAYNELYKKDLVKRIKKQWYLINPAAVFPLFEEYQTVLKKWKSI